MKVMKHGNLDYYHETEHTCATCGCIYRFNLGDITLKVEYSSENDKYVSCNYVVCPECKTAYILNQEEENPQPEPEPTPEPEPVDPDNP